MTQKWGVKGVVSGTPELMIFFGNYGVCCSFCHLDRIFHSHSLIYSLLGSQF